MTEKVFHVDTLNRATKSDTTIMFSCTIENKWVDSKALLINEEAKVYVAHYNTVQLNDAEGRTYDNEPMIFFCKTCQTLFQIRTQYRDTIYHAIHLDLPLR